MNYIFDLKLYCVCVCMYICIYVYMYICIYVYMSELGVDSPSIIKIYHMTWLPSGNNFK